MAGKDFSVTLDIESKSVEAMMIHLDTVLNPVAIAGFLGAVVDPYIRERAEQRFASEGDDVSGPWAPLSEATQNIRASLGYGPSHPINKREGDLEDYITKSPNNLLVSPVGASLTMPGRPPKGEMIGKMRRAQAGSKGENALQGRNRSTPARPVIGLNEADLAFVLGALATYIQKGRP